LKPLYWAHCSYGLDGLPDGHSLCANTPFGRYMIYKKGETYTVSTFMDHYMEDGDDRFFIGNFTDCGLAMLAASKHFKEKITECLLYYNWVEK